jgi:hypothetical protein
MLSRLAIVIVALGLALRPGCSATVELTGRSVDGHVLGVKIEGEIELGDTRKLLKMYEYFGPSVTSQVFLWSRGGDVEEAIKLGRLIRQLRLSTIAPDRFNLAGVLAQFGVHAGPIDRNNNVCASACVLVYAGGVTRSGDLLVLHRPFVDSDKASALSDVEFESAEKQGILVVRQYLEEVEFPEYYIEKLIYTSSQDGYIPTDNDLGEHPLPQMPPSIEEIVLPKCKSLTSIEHNNLSLEWEKKQINNDSKLMKKFEMYSKCESEQVVKLQIEAWNRLGNRLVEPLVDSMCSLKDIGNLLAGRPQAVNCRSSMLSKITSDMLDTALNRGFHANAGDTPPPEFSGDTSILDKP